MAIDILCLSLNQDLRIVTLTGTDIFTKSGEGEVQVVYTAP